jgi:putative FmdB family regulatory protein
MPNYDYDCTACGAEVEILHPMSETRKKCPECGRLQLKRAWRQVAAYHNLFSPMHPRVNRGIGNSGRRKDKKA